MTNDQVKNVKVGDYIRQIFNGRPVDLEVLEVRTVGECVNERSGSFGHAYACLEMKYQNSKLVVGTSIHSDDYTRGGGHKTHDEFGNRVSGWDLIGHNCAV